MIMDLGSLCKENGIIPRGVIHIGAHEGRESKIYNQLGIKHVLFIEANPLVYQKLCANVGSQPHIKTVNCAISDKNGMVELHVTSFDQSSSILPLKKHKELYPGITETQKIAVVSKTLDTLAKELNIPPGMYNMINIDIQGAELLALKGGIETLKNIEAINTEVNFAELYEGCALIQDMDHFLYSCGFTRVKTLTPYHPSWGDAFYVKNPGKK
jgi:FkbM family methyltransferase